MNTRMKMKNSMGMMENRMNMMQMMLGQMMEHKSGEKNQKNINMSKYFLLYKGLVD